MRKRKRVLGMSDLPLSLPPPPSSARGFWSDAVVRAIHIHTRTCTRRYRPVHAPTATLMLQAPAALVTTNELVPGGGHGPADSGRAGCGLVGRVGIREPRALRWEAGRPKAEPQTPV